MFFKRYKIQNVRSKGLYKYITPLIGLYVSWSFTFWRLEQPDSLTQTLAGTHFTLEWEEAHVGLVIRIIIIIIIIIIINATSF